MSFFVHSLCFCYVFFFFFKQKTAYEMRISDWSSDVCSSDLHRLRRQPGAPGLGPGIEGRRVPEQVARAGAGASGRPVEKVGQAAEGQGEVGSVLAHPDQQVLGEAEVAVPCLAEAQLAAQHRGQFRLEPWRKPVDGLDRKSPRLT